MERAKIAVCWWRRKILKRVYLWNCFVFYLWLLKKVIFQLLAECVAQLLLFADVMCEINRSSPVWRQRKISDTIINLAVSTLMASGLCHQRIPGYHFVHVSISVCILLLITIHPSCANIYLVVFQPQRPLTGLALCLFYQDVIGKRNQCARIRSFPFFPYQLKISDFSYWSKSQ